MYCVWFIVDIAEYNERRKKSEIPFRGGVFFD